MVTVSYLRGAVRGLGVGIGPLTECLWREPQDKGVRRHCVVTQCWHHGGDALKLASSPLPPPQRPGIFRLFQVPTQTT